MDPSNKPIRVAVVGACASGKSSLVTALLAKGYEARHVAQEHSYVPNMWQRISKPDILIYLDVDLDAIRRRRPSFDFNEENLREQKLRLTHARQQCDLYLDSSDLTIDDVRRLTFNFLEGFKDSPTADSPT